MGNPFRRTSTTMPKPLTEPVDSALACSQGSTNSKASGGLLPTTKVNVATASKPQSEYFNAVAGSHLYSSQLAGHHDAAYYANWNKERQETIARGEDPNAKFLALVAEKQARSKTAKLRRFFSGKKPHGQGLTEEEEREALERDETVKAAARGKEGGPAE